MSSILVRDLIDSARTRHWSFSNLQLGDGAALLFLNQRQRTRLAQGGAKIEGLVGTSMEYSLVSTSGLLVAYLSGVPTYTTTYQDGWPLHLTGGGVPYVDPSEALIARDPFGQNGGTPGFPLPTDFVRLITVTLTFGPGTPATYIPCQIIGERERFTSAPGRDPICFVSGNRLVPLLPSVGTNANVGNRWFSVTAIQISYVAVQTFTALTDAVNLPSVLCECLTADLAELFATQSKDCPAADKTRFSALATQAASAFADNATDLIGSPKSSMVHYRG